MRRTEVVPAFQLYAADFLSDTLGMTLEEKGAYASALAISWRQGGLPTGTKELARLLGVSSRKLSKLWDVLEPMFERRGERWVLAWQEKLRLDYAMLRQQRSEAGRRGNEVRWRRRAEVRPDPLAHVIAPGSQRDPIPIARNRSASAPSLAESRDPPMTLNGNSVEASMRSRKPGVRETAEVFARIRSLERSNGTSRFIPADRVRALGNRAWVAYNVIGGAERLLNLAPKDLPFVIREFREAYCEDPTVQVEGPTVQFENSPEPAPQT